MRREKTAATRTASHANPPGLQAGSPLVRAEATTNATFPYALKVGEHDSARLPMTAAGVRTLRDALTELLDDAAAAGADDFVTAWARANGATVCEGVASATAGQYTEPATAEPATAEPATAQVVAAEVHTAQVVTLPTRPRRQLLAA